MTFTSEDIAQQIAEAKAAYPRISITVGDEDGTPEVVVSIDHPVFADRDIFVTAHLTEFGWLRATVWNRMQHRYEIAYPQKPNGWVVLHAPSRAKLASDNPDEVSPTIEKIAGLVAKMERLEKKAFSQ